MRKKKYSINFCDSYIFEKVRTVQFFWCVNKENSLKNEVEYFLQMLVLCLPLRDRPHLPCIRAPVKAVFLASPFTFALKSLKPRQLAQLHLWLESPFPLPLILWNRSNALLSPHCQPSRHFVFKDKLRSKNAGKVKILIFVDITWHCRSIARSFVGHKL